MLTFDCHMPKDQRHVSKVDCHMPVETQCLASLTKTIPLTAIKKKQRTASLTIIPLTASKKTQRIASLRKIQ